FRSLKHFRSRARSVSCPAYKPVGIRPVHSQRALRRGQIFERTTTMAIHASFNTGVLTETGDNLGNTITTSLDAAGQILVNGGAVSIDGGQPINTTEIVVSGGNGDDTISLGNAALPPPPLFRPHPHPLPTRRTSPH